MYQSNWKVHKPNASRDGEWMMLTVFQLDEKFLKFLKLDTVSVANSGE